VQVAEPVAPASCVSGLIHIDLPGGVRVSVDADVDRGALARVLSVLR
jgi:transposase